MASASAADAFIGYHGNVVVSDERGHIISINGQYCSHDLHIESHCWKLFPDGEQFKMSPPFAGGPQRGIGHPSTQ